MVRLESDQAPIDVLESHFVYRVISAISLEMSHFIVAAAFFGAFFGAFFAAVLLLLLLMLMVLVPSSP